MSKVIIVGATGSIAKIVEQNLIHRNDVELTLLARRPERLDENIKRNKNIRQVHADVLEYKKLKEAIEGQDIVYANLYGMDLEIQAQNIVRAMKEVGVKRIIWISANGIDNELPTAYGQWNARMLGTTLNAYRAGARVIESSGLDYTIIRPSWFQNKDEIDYIVMQPNEPFQGTEISRKSVADYVTKLIVNPNQEIRNSVGISKAGTDGPKPSWF